MLKFLDDLDKKNKQLSNLALLPGFNFEDYDSVSIKEELIEFIKSKRTHNIFTTIRRVYK